MFTYHITTYVSVLNSGVEQNGGTCPKTNKEIGTFREISLVSVCRESITMKIVDHTN